MRLRGTDPLCDLLVMNKLDLVTPDDVDG